jgi:hypothetical protein
MRMNVPRVVVVRGMAVRVVTEWWAQVVLITWKCGVRTKITRLE